MPDRETVSFTFGPFVLTPERQQLRSGGEMVRLGSRALSLLTALVERPGELITKRELFARAWPDTFVEEGNLKVNMAALRRALQDDVGAAQYVATVVGRGYRFIAPVHCSGAGISGDEAPATGNLPPCSPHVIGREQEIDAVLHALQTTRLISIVGTGGVGKTMVALAVATRFAAAGNGSAFMVDLPVVQHEDAIPTAIAAAAGAPIDAADPVDALCGHLKDRDLLILLDGCEPFVDAVASLTDRLLSATRHVRILVTSREPLRIKEERQYRLSPLACPPALHPLTLQEAVTYPAVKLLEGRIKDLARSYPLVDTDAAQMAKLCRKLDGLPLAIEIAATWLDVFGLEELAMLPPDRFRRLSGLRANHARHRTLGATMDWSFDLLSQGEQQLLRRLAAFDGAFSLASACALGGLGRTDTARIVCDLAGLVAKSMVAADTQAIETSYRLLKPIRAYALEKLAEYADEEELCLDFVRTSPSGDERQIFPPSAPADYAVAAE